MQEWIEIFNSNNFDVDLSGWKISDTAGTITNYTFSKDVKILSGGFLILKRPDTKIMLNNDEDGLNFYTPDGKIIDSVTYTKAPTGQSYNKTDLGWQWSTTLTPGFTNKISQPTIAVNAKNALSKTKKSDNLEAV